MADQYAVLKNVPLFSELDADALDLLLTHSRSLSFRKNTVLMSEGETGESMYVVRSGSIKIFVSDEDGHEIVLYIEGPGSYIGEISLLDDAPRTASAVTLEKNRSAGNIEIRFYYLYQSESGNRVPDHWFHDTQVAPCKLIRFAHWHWIMCISVWHQNSANWQRRWMASRYYPENSLIKSLAT